ncbi:sulfurtransferase TusA family protein [Halalkalibacter nanhaiisediminis]|uniref:Rhodanese-related sulfurtransferase n=1 Tax=Halalkalibacter nanhaiisediminis TaxID=688079 RepID=A0A562QBI9_9BACI|nr:sulfurtransferase TusA family protein [Halalkalibacter nanhaiisediminis]TWI54094.1 rhodanese-related sulfurtransferase [Halalkalibacter nanhaiisediminis]
MSIKVDHVLDAKGLACPMPIIKTKKALDELKSGQVLEVQATDKGSLADLQAWAKSTGHQYLGTNTERDVLVHYVRKADPSEVKEEVDFPNVITNEELEGKLDQNGITILDVREPAEYAFSRIPNATSIPLGELESRLGELNPIDKIYVVCRTGTRSAMAAQLLANNGFTNVTNVKPGMSQWQGNTEQN